MRVALITDGIWSYVLGGMQKHSYYLCKYLAQNKVDVDLYHFNQSNLDINKLDVFTEAEKEFIHSIIVDFPQGNNLPGHYIKSSYEYSKNIFQKLEPNISKYDFIYTKGFTGWYLMEQKRSGAIKCAPIGVKFHGYEMFQKAPSFKSKLQQIFVLRKPVKEISQMADVVFSYGGKITDIIKQIGVPLNKIIELPSGVEESIIVKNFKPTGPIIKFVYLGRYERRKGVEELNSALKQLPENLNFEFHFIGPIPKEKQISNKKIIYHGENRDKNELNALLQSGDVLVCASWSEGMPNVILEAMANGLTVLATNVGATNLLVNEKTGWLMENCSIKEIKTDLEKIISFKAEVLDSKKQSALDLIKSKFTWEKLIKELIKKLEN